MNKQTDVLIIGGGPAGMTAALYTKRSDLSTMIVEKSAPGGKLVNQSKIENWPGTELTTGANLAMGMYKQVTNLGVQFEFSELESVKGNTATLSNGTIVDFKKLIIATGISEIVPKQIKNIESLNHKGVSYCAICDGPIYKGQPTAIIGSGNSAFEEGAYLASTSSKVYLFVRDITAEKALVKTMEQLDNVEIIHEEVQEIIGTDKVVGIKTDKSEYEVFAVFPYVGFRANTTIFKDLIELDKAGNVIVDNLMRTSNKDIYSIGDVNAKDIRQITTAVADGTIAAKHIVNSIV